MPKLSEKLASSKSVCRAEIKWILLRQLSAALLEVSVQRERPIKWPLHGLRLTEQLAMHTWKGLVKVIKEECNEEVEAVVEMSEDRRGQRQLVCPSCMLVYF